MSFSTFGEFWEWSTSGDGISDMKWIVGMLTCSELAVIPGIDKEPNGSAQGVNRA